MKFEFWTSSNSMEKVTLEKFTVANTEKHIQKTNRRIADRK